MAGAGVIVGQVLSDASGLPLPGATVRLFTSQGLAATVTSDERGRYALPSDEAQVLLVVEHDGFTGVAREVSVQTGVGTLPLDARLTPLAAPVTVGVSGGVLTAPLAIAAPSLGASGATAAANLSLGTGGAKAPAAGAQAALNGEAAIAQRYKQVRAATSSEVTLTVPPDALAGDTDLRLTSLSAQGLPVPLPLGWSPLVALDLRRDSGSGELGELALEAGGLPLDDGVVQLVECAEALHVWTLRTAGVAVTGGALSASVPGLGVYAFVVADAGDPPLLPPLPGEALPARAMVELPLTATAEGTVEPPIVPPNFTLAEGERAPSGSVVVRTAPGVPSGTAVQAEVTETYRLASGQIASEERRLEDVLLYQTPLPAEVSLGATFPVMPSRSYDLTELTSGTVHVEVKAGRESVRGESGGADAVVATSGDASVAVPAGALPQNTAVSLQAVALDDFVPQTSTLVALGEIELDLSGLALSLPATLSLATSAVQAGDTLLVACVERVLGVPALRVVALASFAGGRVVTQGYPGLPGVLQGGRYVFYRVTTPLGFVGGVTTAAQTGAPLRAVVTSDTLPLIALSAADGHYLLVTGEGANSVTASVPGTSLTATAPASVSAGQTTVLDFALEGTLTTAVVRPADGAPAVDPSQPIQIEASTPLRPDTVTPDTIQLFKLEAANGNALVPLALRLVLSGSRKLVAVIPEAALEFATTYRLQVSGLADVYGGLVVIGDVTFRTKDNVLPVYDLNALVFSIPDENGLVQVEAPNGTLPPGSRVLVINTGNGVVVSFTADNDGAVHGDLPATVEDRLLITVSDPFGNVSSFERSQYFDAATGQTAVGTGGGRIEGPGGSAMVIPAGALDHPVKLKLVLLGPDAVPQDERPDNENATVAGALRVEASAPTKFKKEVALELPKPADAPERDDLFWFVQQKVEGPNGSVLYDTVDYAYQQGTGAEAKIVTASPPFKGFDDTLVSIAAILGTGPVLGSVALMVWSWQYPFEVTQVKPGSITGKVLRVKWGSPGNAPQYEAVDGAVVVGKDAGGGALFDAKGAVARSQGDGTYTLFDPRYVGGPVTVTAEVVTPQGVQRATGTGYEANPIDTSNYDARFRRFNIAKVNPAGRRRVRRASAGLATTREGRRRLQGAEVNVVFPAQEPPPPPPQVGVRLFKLLGDDDARQEIAGGLVPADTPLVVGLTPVERDGFTITIGSDGAKIQGVQMRAVGDPLRRSPERLAATTALRSRRSRRGSICTRRRSPTCRSTRPRRATCTRPCSGAARGSTTRVRRRPAREAMSA